MKHTIYGFVNGSSSMGVIVESISDEGLFLGQHLCSHEGFGPHDIGVTSGWKHEWYRAAYPDGFEVVWVDGRKGDDGREGLDAAYAKHLAWDAEAYKARMDEIAAKVEAEKAAAR